MIIAITVKIIIIILLLVVIIIQNNNNNDNVKKNQVTWLKKCFSRLRFKVFKLSVFFYVSRIPFQNERQMKNKAFWPVFVFRRRRLDFKKLFLKLILSLGANSKT